LRVTPLAPALAATSRHTAAGGFATSCHSIRLAQSGNVQRLNGADMTNASDKLGSPGALRMALAFAVFVHHTTLFNLGMAAVLIFFVLSGYWVATMWDRTYSKTSQAYFTFLVSRFWRVAPVFALCSAIAWALLYWRGGAPEQLAACCTRFSPTS
jgi:peptidoglycan/LPS O-acetylase OafA/YrhL